MQVKDHDGNWISGERRWPDPELMEMKIESRRWSRRMRELYEEAGRALAKWQLSKPKDLQTSTAACSNEVDPELRPKRVFHTRFGNFWRRLFISHKVLLDDYKSGVLLRLWSYQEWCYQHGEAHRRIAELMKQQPGMYVYQVVYGRVRVVNRHKFPWML